ncbi:MAG: histidine kinase [Cyanobacteria bacterium RYN_339]|nr:histidine kinase [Cyanobacteria bacterium RYN_339]
MSQNFFEAHLGEPAESWQVWLDRSARVLGEVSGALGTAIWLDDHAVDALQIAASFRMSEEYVAYGQQSALMPAARTNAPVYLSFQSGACIKVANPGAVPDWRYFTDGFQDYPIRFIYTAPIGLGTRRVGAIALYFEHVVEVPDTVVAKLQVISTEIAGQLLRRDAHVRLESKLRELEQSNALLVDAVTKMREVDRLKSNFVSAISHELRTPLTSIMGYAEFLEDGLGGAPTDDQLGFIHEIQGGSVRLLQLVDDLLDFARLQAGTFELSFQESDMGVIIRRAVSSLAPLFKKAKLHISEHYDAPDAVAQVDPARVGQVALNLLANAIKFTPPGGRIEVRVLGHATGVRVEIRDTGIGVSPDLLPRIFDKFFQADPGLDRSRGGVGLGLAIGKALVDAHGGAIGADSVPGQGSTFWFELPRLPSQVLPARMLR